MKLRLRRSWMTLLRRQGPGPTFCVRVRCRLVESCTRPVDGVDRQKSTAAKRVASCNLVQLRNLQIDQKGNWVRSDCYGPEFVLLDENLLGAGPKIRSTGPARSGSLSNVLAPSFRPWVAGFVRWPKQTHFRPSPHQNGLSVLFTFQSDANCCR